MTVYHKILLNTFNDQQLVISMGETKNRKIPENLNTGELLYISTETTQKQMKNGKENIYFYPTEIIVSKNMK